MELIEKELNEKVQECIELKYILKETEKALDEVDILNRDLKRENIKCRAKFEAMSEDFRKLSDRYNILRNKTTTDTSTVLLTTQQLNQSCKSTTQNYLQIDTSSSNSQMTPQEMNLPSNTRTHALSSSSSQMSNGTNSTTLDIGSSSQMSPRPLNHSSSNSSSMQQPVTDSPHKKQKNQEGWDTNHWYAFNDEVPDGRSYGSGQTSTTNEQWTPLHIAAFTGSSKSLIFQLKFKPQINPRDKDGNTPIHLAVKYNQLVTANLLLDQKASIDLQNNEGDTAVILAVKNGFAELLEMLLAKRPKALTKNRVGNAALFVAINDQRLGLARRLLQYDAHRNIVSKDGETLLQFVILKCQDIDMMAQFVELLLEFKAKVTTTKTQKSDPPLHLAIQKNLEVVVQLLIRHGPSVHVLNSFGQSPLHIAVIAGRVGIAKQLIDAGACPGFQDKDGNTALHLTSKSVASEAIGNLILTSKPDLINTRNHNGETPLVLTMLNGKSVIVNTLLKLGANPNIPDKEGKTFFHNLSRAPITISHSAIEGAPIFEIQDHNCDYPIHIVRTLWLIKRLLTIYGHNPNQRDKNGCTPLMRAVIDRCPDVVSYLLYYNVDKTLRNHEGKTVFDLATAIGDEEVIAALGP